jgi:hypothetical protein
MMAQRRKIPGKPDNDEKWERLFQKTIESIELFSERPDLLSAFVNALRTGEFPRPQRPFDTRSERRSDDRDTITGEIRTFPRRRRG